MSTQIHDLGYRAYTGERAGVRWAVRSLAIHSVRRALGLKRAGKHKIVPVITIIFAFLPALIMVGLAAFLPDIGQTDLVKGIGSPGPAGAIPHEQPGLSQGLQLVAKGELQPERLVTGRIPLSEVGTALAAMDGRQPPGITVVDELDR